MWSLEDRTYNVKYTNSGLRHVEVCIVSVALTDSVTLSKSLNLLGLSSHVYIISLIIPSEADIEYGLQKQTAWV